MPIRLTQVDAFTDRPFHGNPAAVCFLEQPRPDPWLQAVAAEMNLSETAFLWERPDGFALRWFTPAVEVDLCGHATLASAHVLWEEGRLAPGKTALFHTRCGLLTARRDGEWIELDFPATPAAPAETPPGLAEALGTEFAFVGRSRFDYLVELESESVVRDLRPDFSALKRIPSRGIMVTARGAAPYDFVSRFFGPAAGIDEDPVTGSAHCCLGPYWREKLGREQLFAYQASARGGEVRVRVGDERVYLGGKAITVLRADLLS
jgi:PhzF family phenazine biosynthesis protein